MDKKIIYEIVCEKLYQNGYQNAASKDFPCSVWITKETDEELFAVCLFNAEADIKKSDGTFCDKNVFTGNPTVLNNIMKYVQQKVKEQQTLTCHCLALVISSDIGDLKSLLSCEYPVWFLDDDGRVVIFDNQLSEFGRLKRVLTRKEGFFDRHLNINRNKSKIPSVTLVLVILNVAVQLIVLLQTSGGKTSRLMDKMVLNIGAFVETPQYWRLITSTFLHFGWSHLFNNMIVLLYLGSLAEKYLGKKRFLTVYLISGIGANIASVWWYAARQELFIKTAGASGAIFGVAGLILGIVIFSRDHLKDITLRQIALMILFTLYNGYTEPGVNNCAHLVGGIIGFCSSIFMKWQRGGEK